MNTSLFVVANLDQLADLSGDELGDRNQAHTHTQGHMHTAAHTVGCEYGDNVKEGVHYFATKPTFL